MFLENVRTLPLLSDRVGRIMGSFSSKCSKSQDGDERDRRQNDGEFVGEVWLVVKVVTAPQTSPAQAEWHSSGENTEWSEERVLKGVKKVVKKDSDVFSFEEHLQGRKSRFGGGSGVRRRTGIGRNVCYACGVVGHWRRNCPSKRSVGEVKEVKGK